MSVYGEPEMYTFGRLLKMLLVSTPKWSESQEKVIYES